MYKTKPSNAAVLTCMKMCVYLYVNMCGSQARSITSSRWSQGRSTLSGSRTILIASCTTPGTPSHGNPRHNHFTHVKFTKQSRHSICWNRCFSTLKSAPWFWEAVAVLHVSVCWLCLVLWGGADSQSYAWTIFITQGELRLNMLTIKIERVATVPFLCTQWITTYRCFLD